MGERLMLIDPDEEREKDYDKGLIKFCIVTDVKPGYARVKFPEEDDMVSFWLPVLQSNTYSDKEAKYLDINEHVVCLMDRYLEYGVVLGAIYNNKDLPPDSANKDVWVKVFKDGSVLKYDRNSNVYSIMVDTCQLKISKTGGFTIKNGTESLKTMISDLIDTIRAITVVTPSGNSTPGLINDLDFIALKTRLDNLFES